MDSAAQAAESGRGRVRRLFTLRLNDAGLQKKSNKGLEKHLAMIDKLETKLAHLSEENLKGLAERYVVLGEDLRWPEEATIIRDAYALQKPAPRTTDYAVSVLRSAMGKQALAGGYHAELLDIARRWGPPPSKYEIGQLQARADENQRKHDQIMARDQRGTASRDDQQWLGWYLGLKEECDAILSSHGTAAE